MIKILIVDDEKPICDLIDLNLSASGYQCRTVQDGLEALKLIEEENFDLILLDIMLPGADGYDIMEYIRPMGIPVIFITAKHEVRDRVKGLKLGADDYLVKPFSPAELVARVKSHIQIHERLLEHREQQKEDAIIVKNLAIRPKERRVYLNGEEMNLANKEFEVLLFLAENPNIVFSKDTLFDRIWGMDSVGNTATVTVHINRLREKLEKNADSSTFIETVWGAGYRFKVE